MCSVKMPNSNFVFLIFVMDHRLVFFPTGSTCMQAPETNASSREGCFPRDERNLEQIPDHAAASCYPLLHRIQARSYKVHWNGILHRYHW